MTPSAPRRRASHLGALLLIATSSLVSAAGRPEDPQGPLARLRRMVGQNTPVSSLASTLATRTRPRFGLEGNALADAAFAVPVSPGTRLLSPTVASPEIWAGVQQQLLAASGGGGCICATDRADLDIVKSDAPDPVDPGGLLVYTLDVSNFGPDKAGAVTVVDALPGGVTFAGVVPGPPVCDFAAGQVKCDLGFLPSNTQESIQISVVVGPETTGTLLNTASLGTLTFDPIASNDAASATTAIASPPGETPDGATGIPLRIARGSGTPTDLDLSWGASCSGLASDYSIEEGLIGSWYDHVPVVCSTGGALAETITPASGNTYYLVVPLSAGAEGSYGLGLGVERPVSSDACRPVQALAVCP